MSAWPRGHVARSSALNFAGAAVPALLGLALLPFITAGLGLARFGILGLMLALVEYSNLFGLGLGPATTKYVASGLARRDESTGKLVRVSLVSQTVLGVAGGALVAGFAPLLAERVFDVPAVLQSEAVRVFQIMGLLVPATLLLAGLLGVLEGAHRFGLSNLVRVPTSAMTFVIPAVGVLYGASLATIVAALLAFRLGACVAAAMLVRGVLPRVRSASQAASGHLRQLLRLGAWLSVSNVLNPVLVYGDRFLLGALRGVAAAGLYTAPFDVLLRVHIVPGSLGRVLLPTVSAGSFSGDRLGNAALFARSVRALMWILGIPLGIVALAAPGLLNLWLGPEFAAAAGTATRILAIGVFLNALALVPTNYLIAIGRTDISAKLHMAEAIGFIPLAWALIARFGITGAALAWTIRVLADTLLLFVLTPRIMRRTTVAV